MSFEFTDEEIEIVQWLEDAGLSEKQARMMLLDAVVFRAAEAISREPAKLVVEGIPPGMYETIKREGAKEANVKIRAILDLCAHWDVMTKTPSETTTIPIYKALGVWDEENGVLKA